MYRSSTMGRRTGRILVLFGFFELALAAGFWFISAGDSAAGPGMLLTGILLGGTGVVLLLVGLLMVRRAATKDRISETGVAGTGQIMALRQTGVMLNDQPQVELDLLVTIPGRSPYRAKVKEIVPLIMLNRLEGTLPVRVDPAEPDAVVVQWDQPNVSPGATGPIGSGFDETLAEVSAALAAADGRAAPVYGEAAQAGYTMEQLRAYLRSEGVSGTARVDRLEDSGQSVGDEHLFTMTTTISIPGRLPYTTGPSAAMVPLAKVGRIAVGVALPVRVAPDNPDMVMFEWDRI